MKTSLIAVGLLLAAGTAVAQDAPLFQRPFNGVPAARHEGFTRIVPHVDAKRGTRNFDPANMPGRFSEAETTPAEMDMTGGFAYLGQFIDHDITLILEDEVNFLLPPFVKSAAVEDGEFINLRTPGLDLDSVYGFGPFRGRLRRRGLVRPRHRRRAALQVRRGPLGRRRPPPRRHAMAAV